MSPRNLPLKLHTQTRKILNDQHETIWALNCPNVVTRPAHPRWLLHCCPIAVSCTDSSGVLGVSWHGQRIFIPPSRSKVLVCLKPHMSGRRQSNLAQIFPDKPDELALGFSSRSMTQDGEANW